MKRNMGAIVFLVVLLVFTSFSAVADNIQLIGFCNVSARLTIAIPPYDGATIRPGTSLPVTVTINPAAVGCLTRIDVSLRAANGNLNANAVINSPQASNQVTLQVPANALWGAGTLSAVGIPREGFGFAQRMPERESMRNVIVNPMLR